MGYGGVRSFVRADTTVPLFGVLCLDGMEYGALVSYLPRSYVGGRGGSGTGQGFACRLEQ